MAKPVTLGAYATTWLQIIRQVRAPRTAALYATMVRRYIVPRLGKVPLPELRRFTVLGWVAEMLKSGVPRPSVVESVSVLSSLCSSAVEDTVLQSNPCFRLGIYGALRGGKGNGATHVARKAMTREELDRLLTAAAKTDAWLYPLLLLMARTGLRPGEAITLEWRDFDLEAGVLTVRRSAGERVGNVGPTKSRRVRRVQVTPQTLEALHAHRAAVSELLLASGVRSPYVWPSVTGDFLSLDMLRRRFKKLRAAAGLAKHLTPHCLRHTFATLVLRDAGASLQWVQQQLGHSSIAVTVDVYGSWLPDEIRFADALDDVGE